MSVAGFRRDAITYGVNGTRSSCGEQGVSWLCWCGWGARATILFVGAGLGPARGGIRDVVFESYAEGLLLLSSLPRTSEFPVRSCSGAVPRSLMTWPVLLCASCAGRSGAPFLGRSGTGRCVSCAGRAKVYGAVLALDDGGLRRGIWRGEGAHVRVLAGSRPTESVVLVTISVVRDTPSDRHFSAWSRPKPAPDPLPGPSVASGVIPTKGGRNGPVPATSGRAPQGRWRSSPWKRCNHAPPRSRGQGAPRTARCIKTGVDPHADPEVGQVREHPAPLGALRRQVVGREPRHPAGQGAPRTARCIKTQIQGPVLVCLGRSGTTRPL